MKRIQTNVPEYRPHIRWVMKKLRLRSYDVFVFFCPPYVANKTGFKVPMREENRRYVGKFTGIVKKTGVIWINSEATKRWCGSSVTAIIAHELRHYYQAKLKKFPFTNNIKNLYRIEADAWKFGEWAGNKFDEEVASGKCKLKHIPNNLEIVY